MPIERKDETVAAEPADATVGGEGRDISSDSEGADASETAAPARPKRSRQRKPQPTFDDGATTRVFKFPSRTYPRSAYYVTNDEIIVRIKKARQKWQLTFPKKRIVSYRTNRWFHKPRWVEIELTYPQAVRHGLVGSAAAPAQAAGSVPAPSATASDDLVAVSSVVEGGVSVNEVDAEKPLGEAAQLPVADGPTAGGTTKVEQPGAAAKTTTAPESTAQADAALVPSSSASLSALLARVAHVAQKVEALSETARASGADAVASAATTTTTASAHPAPEDRAAAPARLPAAGTATKPVPSAAAAVVADALPKAAATVEPLAPAAIPPLPPRAPEASRPAVVVEPLSPIVPVAAVDRSKPAVPEASATAGTSVPPISVSPEALAAAGAAAAALQRHGATTARAVERERPAAYYGSKAQRRALSEAPHNDARPPRRETQAIWLWAPVVAMLLLTAGVIWSQWAGDDDFETSIVRSVPRERAVAPGARDGSIVTAAIEPAESKQGPGAVPEQRLPAPPDASRAPTPPAVVAAPGPVQGTTPIAPSKPEEPARDAAPSPAQKQAAAREAAAKKAAEETAAKRRAAEDAAKRRDEQDAAKQRAKEDATRRQAQAAADTAAARRAAELATAASREPIPIPGAAPARSFASSPQACDGIVTSAASTVAIQFEFASASLRQPSIDALHRLAASLAACPAVRLRIEGHTDADGDLNRNQMLSERRATAVLQALITAGTSAGQLSAVGLGQTRPLAPNDTAENKRRNRRIDLVVN